MASKIAYNEIIKEVPEAVEIFKKFRVPSLELITDWHFTDPNLTKRLLQGKIHYAMGGLKRNKSLPIFDPKTLDPKYQNNFLQLMDTALLLLDNGGNGRRAVSMVKLIEKPDTFVIKKYYGRNHYDEMIEYDKKFFPYPIMRKLFQITDNNKITIIA